MRWSWDEPGIPAPSVEDKITDASFWGTRFKRRTLSDSGKWQLGSLGKNDETESLYEYHADSGPWMFRGNVDILGARLNRPRLHYAKT